MRVKVGDEIDLYVTEAGDQVVLAPSLKADRPPASGEMREAQRPASRSSGRVTAVTSGGLRWIWAACAASARISQIESGYCADPSSYVGRTLEFLVTKVEAARGGAWFRASSC